MSDISKCSGKDCPVKEYCVRFISKPSQLQSYIEPHYDGRACVNYWGIE